jgi:CelD/BcsL family acetyltransferase involved in cellulose biosynthesis
MKPERRLPVTPLTLEVVREAARLEQLKSEWTRFAAGLENVTPFQLPEWQIAWWRHFGAGRLHIMLFRSMDTLAGIVPLYLNAEQNRSILKLTGSEMASYLEPPIAPSQRAQVMSLLKGHLLGNTAWDCCDWRDVAVNSSLAGLQLGDSFELKTAPDSEWSEVRIEGTFQEYWHARPFALRRNFLKYLDKTTAVDRPRFEVVTQADPEFVNAVIRLENERAAAFAQAKDGAGTFLADLARVLDDADMLRIFGLRFQGKIVAVLLAFAYRNTLYAFAGGHEAEFEAQGFGRLLLFEALRHSFERGYRAWNFLRGNEPYKLLWGARVTPTARIAIERRASVPAQLQ